MLKFLGSSLATLIMLITLNATATTQQRFEKYRKVEAYEVRPGILMMPRYTADGEVCEIGLERLLYSPDRVRVYSDLSRVEIDQVLDELVPADERGERMKDSAYNQIVQSGNSLVTNIGYENVSIQIYGATSPSRHKNETTLSEVVAKVKWTHRVCR